MEPEPDPLLDKFGNYLSSHCREITEDLENVVRNRISHAQSLSSCQIIDHLPAILSDLADILRDPAKEEPKRASFRHAHKHGEERWKEGYDLTELVREIGYLSRVVCIDWLQTFSDENSDVTDYSQNLCRTNIHEYFNEISAAATDQFVSEQQRKNDQAIKDLENSNRQLDKANKRRAELERSKLLLTQMVSHEIGNLLNIQSAAINLLSQDAEETIRQQMLLTLRTNIRDMAEMLQELVSYSELIAHRVKPRVSLCHPGAILDELALVFSEQAHRKNMDLQVICDPSLDEVITDTLRIKQIMTNLISNALKYGRKKGQARSVVTASFESVDADHWKLSVADEGGGIAAKQRETIFEEFHSLRPGEEAGGSGLGMAITKSLVELLNGTITVQSKVGEGTRFEVLLPKMLENAPRMSGSDLLAQ